MTESTEREIYAKINKRILPLVLVCYCFAYLDRVNIGFAKLQMSKDINIDEAAYGLGAGLFFLGYVVFEVPSNLLLKKIGARATITRIMLLWGLTSTGMMFVRNETSFYVMRILLGIFEAGFAPGIILYLTFWYSRKRMGLAIGVYMLAGPIGSMLGGPLSTSIITYLNGMAGLRGWQWMFLAEGLPCVALAVVVWILIDDSPRNAKWLTDAEKDFVISHVEGHQDDDSQHRFRDALRNPRVYTMAIGYFTLISGLYAVNFWLPTILKDNGIKSTLQIGWLSAIPYLAAIIGMIWYGRRSDKHQERRWHAVIPAFLGAMALLLAAMTGNNFLLSFVGLILATALLQMSYTVFWAVPSEYFTGTAAAGGIALINSIGLLGGFFSPIIIGTIKQATGSTQWGLVSMVGMLVVGTVCLLSIKPRTPERKAEVSGARA